jgi:VWFA-related protein
MDRRLLIRTICACAVSAAAAYAMSGVQAASSQQRTFRTGTTSVFVDVVATDSTGRPIRDLTLNDFHVTEDGEPQPVRTADRIDLPFRVGAENSVASPANNVATNDVRGRVYVVVVDGFHMTPAGAYRTPRVLEQFVREYVQPSDVVAIGLIGWTPRGFEFTSDRNRLLRLVDSVVPGAVGAPSGLAGTFAGEGGDDPSAIADELAMADLNERMLRALTSVIEYAANGLGRRTAMLLLSEGIDTMVYGYANAGDGFRMASAEQALIAAASRSHVNIYAIDPRGLSAIDPFNKGQPGLSQWASLRVLAEGTGGRAILGRTEYRSSFEEIVRENSTYYVLGYVSAHADDRNGKFHAIHVTVNRAGVRISARKGWTAPERRPTKVAAEVERVAHRSDVESMLLRPLPVENAGLSLRAASSAVRVAGGRAQYALVVEGTLSDLAGGATSNGPAWLDIGYRAVADSGRVVAADLQHVTFSRPEVLTAEGGWRWQTEASLPTGHAQLRVAVRARGTGASGAVYLDVDSRVPQVGLELGDIVLSSRRSTMPTAGALPLLASILPGPPTTRRTFMRDDTLAAFARVTDTDLRPHQIAIRTDLRASDGAPVFTRQQPHDSGAFAAVVPGYLAIVPLRTLNPGSYRLSISASTPDTGEQCRSVSFIVQ